MEMAPAQEKQAPIFYLDRLNFVLMRIFFVVLLMISFSCGGSLSSEQRKKIRANMEAKSIKKISDAELTDAALIYARNITLVIESSGRFDQEFLDSLNKVYDVEVIFITQKSSGLRTVERQIIEAYSATDSSTNPGDNLQKMGNDSILYTKPLFEKNQKGSSEFAKALALRIHKKAVILSMKN